MFILKVIKAQLKAVTGFWGVRRWSRCSVLCITGFIVFLISDILKSVDKKSCGKSTQLKRVVIEICNHLQLGIRILW